MCCLIGCYKPEISIWYVFLLLFSMTEIQTLGNQKLRGVVPCVITSYASQQPLHFLSLCLWVLFLLGDTIIVPMNWKLPMLPCPFRLFMPLGNCPPQRDCISSGLVDHAEQNRVTATYTARLGRSKDGNARYFVES